MTKLLWLLLSKRLALVIETFGLVLEGGKHKVLTLTNHHRDYMPEWFSVKGTTKIYVFNGGPKYDYTSNIWVNTDEKIIFLERTWW